MNLTMLVTSLVWSMPLFLIWVGIAAYAFFNHEQHPRRSNLTIAAMGVFLVGRLVQFGASAAAQALAESTGATEPALVYSIIGGVSSLLGMIGWILVGLALFAEPGEASPK